MKRTIWLIIILAWLLVPTGTPDDIITWSIIGFLGIHLYLLLLLVLFIVMWHYKINWKKIRQAGKLLIQKVRRS